METLAMSGLPMLASKLPSLEMPLEGIEALTGAEFLQTLAALSAPAPATAAVPAEAALLQAMIPPAEEPIEDAGDGSEASDASLALQWLPLTQFVETAVPHKATPAPVNAAGEQTPELLAQQVATVVPPAVKPAGAPSPRQTSVEQKTAVPLLPASPATGTESVAAGSAIASELIDGVEAVLPAGSQSDKPPAGLQGASALAATASAATTLQGGNRLSADPAGQPMQAHIPAPVKSARWAEQIGQRITMMAAAGQQTGTLSLTPENMGPLEVRIQISQDNASVWFGAQQADTRAALTDALPRLREMFAANGLSLGEANVSHETSRQGSEGSQGFRGENGALDEAGALDRPRNVQRVSLGLIDTYA